MGLPGVEPRAQRGVRRAIDGDGAKARDGAGGGVTVDVELAGGMAEVAAVAL
jgi:hypothetical protein